MKKFHRDTVTGGILSVMALVFYYGLIEFPDGPITTRGSHLYRGRLGQPHSEREYREYVHWSITTQLLLPLGMIAVLLLQPQLSPRGATPRGMAAPSDHTAAEDSAEETRR